MPLAPGLFSTTTGCDHVLLNLSATSRATASSDPPGAKGTITFTVWSGKFCAKIACGPQTHSIAVNCATNHSLRNL
jgi:hypothetical protein